MRETVGWQILKQMGVDSLISYQTHVRMNGQYYGKFALQEIWKEDSLKANGYSVDPTPGPLFKSTVS